ncbi:MAG: formate dehydrogenase subunit delta [Halioglobus sp.]
MTVKIDKLLQMARQIEANMNYTDDTDIVAAKVSDHLSRFWDPRMKAAIKDYQAENADQLSPELNAAVIALK